MLEEKNIAKVNLSFEFGSVQRSINGNLEVGAVPILIEFMTMSKPYQITFGAYLIRIGRNPIA